MGLLIIFMINCLVNKLSEDGEKFPNFLEPCKMTNLLQMPIKFELMDSLIN